MPFDSAPTNLYPAYTADGTALNIPLADAGLTAAQANTATGDSRAVLRGILDSAFTRIQALPAADRPKKMTITKGQPAVVGNNVLRQTYTVSFDTTYMNSALSMAPEE